MDMGCEAARQRCWSRTASAVECHTRPARARPAARSPPSQPSAMCHPVWALSCCSRSFNAKAAVPRASSASASWSASARRIDAWSCITGMTITSSWTCMLDRRFWMRGALPDRCFGNISEDRAKTVHQWANVRRADDLYFPLGMGKEIHCMHIVSLGRTALTVSPTCLGTTTFGNQADAAPRVPSRPSFPRERADVRD